MSGKELTYTASDGAKLVYDDEGTGKPVLMIHGYSGQRGVWQMQTEALLAAGYRTIVIDQRNHGKSERTAHGQRMSRHGLDVRELIDHLGLEQVTLMGHSMGVSVSLAMMSLFGTRSLAKFIAIDQSPRCTSDETWQWGVKKITWENVWESANFRFPWGERDREPPLPPEVKARFDKLEKFTEQDQASVAQLVLDHFAADWRDVLPRIDVPTWVVTGVSNPFYTVEGMQWFADQIPQGSLGVFEKSGHSPHFSEPAAFNEQMLKFLAA